MKHISWLRRTGQSSARNFTGMGLTRQPHILARSIWGVVISTGHVSLRVREKRWARPVRSRRREEADNSPPSRDCPDVRVELGQRRGGVHKFPWPSRLWIRSRRALEHRCSRVSGADHLSVSPAQEHIQGPQWWTDYQPVSYILTSKRGTREQYENMIHTCHAAGVGVIAGSSRI